MFWEAKITKNTMAEHICELTKGNSVNLSVHNVTIRHLFEDQGQDSLSRKWSFFSILYPVKMCQSHILKLVWDGWVFFLTLQALHWLFCKTNHLIGFDICGEHQSHVELVN
jgi:hypothetical protein